MQCDLSCEVGNALQDRKNFRAPWTEIHFLSLCQSVSLFNFLLLLLLFISYFILFFFPHLFHSVRRNNWTIQQGITQLKTSRIQKEQQHWWGLFKNIFESHKSSNILIDCFLLPYLSGLFLSHLAMF